MKLVYAREAVDDLACLRAFIAENNPQAASKIAADLVDRIEQLCQFPKMGVVVEAVLPPAEIRDMVFGSYIVRYSVHKHAVAILRVWHHFEDRSHPA